MYLLKDGAGFLIITIPVSEEVSKDRNCRRIIDIERDLCQNGAVSLIDGFC
jgi:hypothetical protein